MPTAPSLDWLPDTPAVPVCGIECGSAMKGGGFREWLADRLNVEQSAVLAEMQSQLQSSHKALLAEIIEAHRQSLRPFPPSSKLIASKELAPACIPGPLQPKETAAAHLTEALMVQGGRVEIAIPLQDSPNKHNFPAAYPSEEPIVPGSPLAIAIAVANKKSPQSALKGSPASALSCPSEMSECQGKQKAEKATWQHLLEMVGGVTILLNAFVMLVEQQYWGLEVGYTLGMAGFHSPAKDTFPFAATVFDVLNVFFTLVFTVELMFHIFQKRVQACRSAWVWFDTVVVLGSWIGIFSTGLPSILQSSNLRLLRVVRLFALIELMESFEKLHVMIRSIKGSIGSLLWCMLLIMFTQVMAALFLHFCLAGVYDDLSLSETARQNIFERFGTTSRTILTMFQVIFANWSQPCWLLVLNVSEWYGIFFIVYRCIFGFALLAVVTSMFIAETHKICTVDGEKAALKKQSDVARHTRELEKLFWKVDESGDGKVTWQEMQIMLSNQEFLIWVDKMGINPIHFTELFKIIMKGSQHVEDGYVYLDEFVSSMLKVEGQAMSIDLLGLSKSLERLDAKIDRNARLVNRNANLVENTMPFASLL